MPKGPLSTLQLSRSQDFFPASNLQVHAGFPPKVILKPKDDPASPAPCGLHPCSPSHPAQPLGCPRQGWSGAGGCRVKRERPAAGHLERSSSSTQNKQNFFLQLEGEAQS